MMSTIQSSVYSNFKDELETVYLVIFFKKLKCAVLHDSAYIFPNDTNIFISYLQLWSINQLWSITVVIN